MPPLYAALPYLVLGVGPTTGNDDLADVAPDSVVASCEGFRFRPCDVVGGKVSVSSMRRQPCTVQILGFLLLEDSHRASVEIASSHRLVDGIINENFCKIIGQHGISSFALLPQAVNIGNNVGSGRHD